MRLNVYLAEFSGTFGIVFFGTGAIILNEETEGCIGHSGIAMVFGLSVMTMIYIFERISGAHMNPAVTIGFHSSGLFQKKNILPFIVSQVLGAILASVILKQMFPANYNLGNTIPADDDLQAFLLEILLSFILMLVILYSSQGKKLWQSFAGFIIGMTVGLEALFAGEISGASMNPARSLAPSLLSGNVVHLWVYLSAPVIGTILASYFWKRVKIYFP